jgi:hypothetical protein
MLDVPHELVEHVSWLLYARRRELNSPWRKLGCFKQALLPGPPAEERDVRPGGSWVESVGGDGVAVRGRDTRGPGRLGAGPARGPGGPGGGRLRHRRRDADSRRPHSGRRAALLPETQEARHERPGHHDDGRSLAAVVGPEIRVRRLSDPSAPVFRYALHQYVDGGLDWIPITRSCASWRPVPSIPWTS